MTKYGLALPENPRIFDRRWMIVKNGRHQSQRVLPRMVLIQPSFVKDGLCLRAPNMPDLHISVSQLPTEQIQCQCWDDPILGLRYGDNVSQWLRTYFKTDDELDLVVFDDEKFEGRPVNKCPLPNAAREGDVAAYHDMSPLHLCSVHSIDDLNTRLEKKITVRNFRPNILVANVGQPYKEDHWRELTIGETRLTWMAPCTRCLLPTVDPQTGIKDPKQEPWKTLRSYRLKPKSYGVSALFGIDLAPTDTQKKVAGIIRVGDTIQVNKDDPDFWKTE